MKEKERPEGRKLPGKNRVYSSSEWLTCQEPGENTVQSRKPSSIQDTCTGILYVEYLIIAFKNPAWRVRCLGDAQKL